MRKSVALASGNSARRKERSGEKPYKFYGTHVSFHGGLARVCGHTRVSGVLEGVGGQRPIGSKHSLSERVSWTHASRTRRGLGLPLLERSELSFFLFPPFFFPFLFFLFSRPLHSTAILICLEFAFHAATTTCTPGCCPRGVEQVVIFLFLIFKISRVFLLLRFFSCKILFFFFYVCHSNGKKENFNKNKIGFVDIHKSICNSVDLIFSIVIFFDSGITISLKS